MRLKQFEWNAVKTLIMNPTVYSYFPLQNNTAGWILRTFQAAVVVLHEQRWDPSSFLTRKRCWCPQVPGADEEKQTGATGKDWRPAWLVQRPDLIMRLWRWRNPPLPQGARDSAGLTDQGKDGGDAKQTPACIISHFGFEPFQPNSKFVWRDQRGSSGSNHQQWRRRLRKNIQWEETQKVLAVCSPLVVSRVRIKSSLWIWSPVIG